MSATPALTVDEKSPGWEMLKANCSGRFQDSWQEWSADSLTLLERRRGLQKSLEG